MKPLRLSQIKKIKDTDARNAATSQFEVRQFMAHRPSKYFAYLSSDGTAITTWIGDKLGDVIHTREFPKRGYVSEKLYSVRIRAVNGKTYHGMAYAGKGGYVRMREVKK